MLLIGIDASSTNVGISKFEIIGTDICLKYIKHFKLDSKKEIYERFEEFTSFINAENFEVAVMEARLKSFFHGQTNKAALLAVGAANEIVSYIVYQKCKRIYKYHPSSLRKSAGIKSISGIDIKEIVLNYTLNHTIFIKSGLKKESVFKKREVKRGKNIGNEVWDNGVYDKSDSFAIGIGGINLIGYDLLLND